MEWWSEWRLFTVEARLYKHTLALFVRLSSGKLRKGPIPTEHRICTISLGSTPPEVQLLRERKQPPALLVQIQHQGQRLTIQRAYGPGAQLVAWIRSRENRRKEHNQHLAHRLIPFRLSKAIQGHQDNCYGCPYPSMNAFLDRITLSAPSPTQCTLYTSLWLPPSPTPHQSDKLFCLYFLQPYHLQISVCISLTNISPSHTMTQLWWAHAGQVFARCGFTKTKN